MSGSAERGKVRLISREIIVQEFQPIMTTISQRHRQTDGRTDNLAWKYHAMLISFARS